MRVLVTGATGLIGSRLVDRLRERGDEAVALSLRSLPVPVSAVEGCDGIVNLAGEPVARRWSPAVKERIRSSRVDGTRSLVEALRAASPRPSVLVSASGSGYYGHLRSDPVDESASPGNDFLASVCVEWEAAARGAEAYGVRVAGLLTGVVLSKGGGALVAQALAWQEAQVAQGLAWQTAAGGASARVPGR